MKKNLSIIILSVTLLGVQACLSDREKQASKETPVVKTSLTLGEQRDNLENKA